MHRIEGSLRPVVLLVLLALATVLLTLPGCERKDYSAFAKCLTSKQVTMYGLYWCDHCAEQKKMFGPSFQYVTYMECGIKGSRAEQPVCSQAGVKNFPTWKLPNGSLVEGVQPLQKLSEMTGCSLQ
ncbi:MAG TPA: hypothetical protein VIW67_15550 [Terriglobales bacterium]|jgi:glutaredoxin